MSGGIAVQRWSSKIEADALAFLKARYATSMFLLGNLADQGPALTDHPNSGNLKVITNANEVVAVFNLTRRGNLLVTAADLSIPTRELILRECLAEPIALKGVIGGWEASSSLWEYFAEHGVVSTCSFNSKEILFQLDPIPAFEAIPRVRFLDAADFEQWLPIRRAYTEEEGIKHDLPDEELKATFIRYSAAREYWGYFEGTRLIATTALNARALDIGQVGGVYTVPSHRSKGLSQMTMRQMLNDCARVHKLSRMILFTGENNLPARRVYEKLGFRRIGYFGIFFS